MLKKRIPYMLIVVPIIALYNPTDDTILLSVRQTGKQLAGFYEFPGGKTEAGELPSQALCREIYEELDIHIKVTDLTPVTFTDFHFETKAYVLCMYYCDTYTGETDRQRGTKNRIYCFG